MIFSSKYLVPAAAFAAVASVAISAPAQAFAIGEGFRFNVDSLTITGTPDNYTFDFGSNGVGVGDFGFGEIAQDLGGNFVVGDSIVIKDIVEPGQPPVADWLTSIDYAPGQQAKFDLTSISYTVVDGFLNLKFDGFLKDSGSGSFLSLGSFTMTDLVVGAENIGTGTIKVTDVPTPAAVLPVIGGLLGMASKRKRNGEEA